MQDSHIYIMSVRKHTNADMHEYKYVVRYFCFTWASAICKPGTNILPVSSKHYQKQRKFLTVFGRPNLSDLQKILKVYLNFSSNNG